MGIRALVARASLGRTAMKTKSAPLSLPLELKDKALLVLLPARQQDITVVKQVLPQITAIFGDRNVYVMAFPNMDVQSIFPTKGFRIISPRHADLNWCRLPSRTFLDKLRQHKFDFIFDTNLEENKFAARILLDYPKAVRFGNQGRLGLPYLNLEVKTKFLRDRSLIYRSILEVVANLSTSSPREKTITEEQSCT